VRVIAQGTTSTLLFFLFLFGVLLASVSAEFSEPAADAAHECSGNSPFPAGVDRCYSASRIGVTVDFKIRMTSDSDGTLDFNVSGLLSVNCPEVPLSQTGQTIAVDETAFNACLPPLVRLDTVTYCSDQDDLVIKFARPMPLQLHLSPLDCAALDASSASANQAADDKGGRRLEGLDLAPILM